MAGAITLLVEAVAAAACLALVEAVTAERFDLPLGQTSSDRLACLAAARLAVRRSLSVFCAGFFPSFLGFCEPFTCILLVGRVRRRS